MLHRSRSLDVWERLDPVRKANLEQLGRLQPEVKVKMAIEMTEAMASLCIEGIKAQNPKVTKEELMERLRCRFEWAKRSQGRGGRVK